MYLHHELRLVTQHRQTEALKRIHWLHSLMGIQPGFIRTLACRYLGSPDRYAWLRLWNEPGDNTTFRQTPEAKEFAATRPEGLYEPLPGGIADNGHWQSVIEPQGKDLGSFLVRSAFRVGEGRDAEFIEMRHQYDKAAFQVPGITWIATFHRGEAGAENLYLTLLRAIDREAFNELLESPLAASYREKLPAGLHETLTTECYLIVDEVVPTKAGASRVEGMASASGR